ncbi:hypothetical protein BKA69DRAFT_1076618 [Paraphysoderma sedebokerense]|nr:hypothetical protein BKA69DRAFT_1076618 [Paraphysoderma sedebokerense]
MKSTLLSIVVATLISTNAIAAPAPAPEPVLPAIGSAAAWAGKIALGLGVGGSIAAGTGYGISAHRKKKNGQVNWTSPVEGDEWKCGETYNVTIKTVGLGSVWGVSKSKLILTNDKSEEVSTIMNTKTFRFVIEDTKAKRPRPGNGTFSWQIPEDTKAGEYTLVYQASSRLKYSSPKFKIECSEKNNTADRPLDHSHGKIEDSVAVKDSAEEKEGAQEEKGAENKQAVKTEEETDNQETNESKAEEERKTKEADEKEEKEEKEVKREAETEKESS